MDILQLVCSLYDCFESFPFIRPLLGHTFYVFPSAWPLDMLPISAQVCRYTLYMWIYTICMRAHKTLAMASIKMDFHVATLARENSHPDSPGCSRVREIADWFIYAWMSACTYQTTSPRNQPSTHTKNAFQFTCVSRQIAQTEQLKKNIIHRIWKRKAEANGQSGRSPLKQTIYNVDAMSHWAGIFIDI